MQCPNCGFDIDISGCEVGEIVSCPSCKVDLELGVSEFIDLDFEEL